MEEKDLVEKSLGTISLEEGRKVSLFSKKPYLLVHMYIIDQ